MRAIHKAVETGLVVTYLCNGTFKRVYSSGSGCLHSVYLLQQPVLPRWSC